MWLVKSRSHPGAAPTHALGKFDEQSPRNGFNTILDDYFVIKEHRLISQTFRA